MTHVPKGLPPSIIPEMLAMADRVGILVLGTVPGKPDLLEIKLATPRGNQ